MYGLLAQVPIDQFTDWANLSATAVVIGLVAWIVTKRDPQMLAQFRDESRAERHAFLDALNQQRLAHTVNLQKQILQSDAAAKEAREFYAAEIRSYRDHAEKMSEVGFETMNNLSSELRLLRESIAAVDKLERLGAKLGEQK